MQKTAVIKLRFDAVDAFVKHLIICRVLTLLCSTPVILPFLVCEKAEAWFLLQYAYDL